MTTTGTPGPPKALLIYRDALIAGREADFKAIEEDAARICVELDCPNTHLAIESLTGPKEVWWLTPYESDSDIPRVAEGYASNPSLVAALNEIAKRREGVTEMGTDILAAYRADLSRGAPWQLAGARFMVVAVSTPDLPIDFSVFEAADGSRFILRPVGTRQEADAIAAASGPDTRVFAVRPYWGMPAKQWIDADPEFWKSNPMARRK